LPVRVLLVTGSYPPDRSGVGDYTRVLAKALAGQPETQVTVLTTGNSLEAIDDAGVAVFRSVPDWSMRHAGFLMRHLRRERPDIVHVQYPTLGFGYGLLAWLVPLIARYAGARVIQTWHEGFNHHLRRFPLLALAPSRVVVVRKPFLRQFGRLFGFIAGLRRPLYINGGATLPKADLTPEQAAALRRRYGIGAKRPIVFFGFIHPSKHVELLFEIADADTDFILVVGSADGQEEYVAMLTALTQSPRWRNRSLIAGFADREEAAEIIDFADAIVLPLKTGGGEWNSSILAAIQQGTFVLTTSVFEHGYNADKNIYYSKIDDLDEMRHALKTYAGMRRVTSPYQNDIFHWPAIAARHIELYRSVLPRFRRVGDA
jgi:glycosyltransferase involved in cell wall biosynthesis